MHNCSFCSLLLSSLRLWKEVIPFDHKNTFPEASYPFINFDVAHKTVVLKCLWHLAVVLLYLVWLHVSKQQTVCQLMFKILEEQKQINWKKSFQMQRPLEENHSVAKISIFLFEKKSTFTTTQLCFSWNGCSLKLWNRREFCIFSKET